MSIKNLVIKLLPDLSEHKSIMGSIKIFFIDCSPPKKAPSFRTSSMMRELGINLISGDAGREKMRLNISSAIGNFFQISFVSYGRIIFSNNKAIAILNVLLCDSSWSQERHMRNW